MLWKDGAITIEVVQAARQTKGAVKLKRKENKITGKKTTTYAVFLEMLWKKTTDKYLKSIMRLSTEDMALITDQSVTTAKKVKAAEERSAESTEGEDSDNMICNGTGSSESEDGDGDGDNTVHIPQWKNQSAYHSTILCRVSNGSLSKLPRRRQRSPVTRMILIPALKGQRIRILSTVVTPRLLNALVFLVSILAIIMMACSLHLACQIVVMKVLVQAHTIITRANLLCNLIRTVTMATVTESMGESCLFLSFLPHQFTGSVSVVLDVFPVEVGAAAKEVLMRGSDDAVE